MHLPLSPSSLSSFVSPLISHPLADAFEEFSQDLESAKTRLEVEVQEFRKSDDGENKVAETAPVRIQRELQSTTYPSCFPIWHFRSSSRLAKEQRSLMAPVDTPNLLPKVTLE